MQNYLMQGLYLFKESVLQGILVYIIIYITCRVIEKKIYFSIRHLFELFFCIWIIMVLSITGILPINAILNTASKKYVNVYNINFIPFVGGAIIPIFLNFVLFIPLGVLFPLVYHKNCNYRKIIVFGALLSLFIEFSQMFLGRNVEVDDIFMNTLGTVVGYSFYLCFLNLKNDKRKAFMDSIILVFANVVIFAGIWIICNRTSVSYDNYDMGSVEDNISDIILYFGKDTIKTDASSDEYAMLISILDNCGGHNITIENVYEYKRNMDDYYIEVIFNEPQMIEFYSVEDYKVEETCGLLYDVNSYVVYWTNKQGIYNRRVDYSVVGDEMTEHLDEMYHQYDELKELLTTDFE